MEHLTELKVSDMPDHKLFLNKNIRDLYKANSISELFAMMSTYWNYLSYHLLAHLIEVYSMEELKEEMDMQFLVETPIEAHLIKKSGMQELKEEMEKYKIDLQQFLEETLIKVFYKAQKKRWLKPPNGFKAMVTKFDWPENITLSKVEEFRQQYVSSNNLLDCALLLIQIKLGSFTVVWFIPLSVVERLSREVDEKLLMRFSVSSMEIGGRLLYLKQKPEEVRFLLSVSK